MEMLVPKKHWGALVCAVTILGLLCFYLTSLVIQENVIPPIESWSTDGTCHNSPFSLYSTAHATSKPDPDPFRSLINDLKERTRVAAANRNFTFTEEDEKEWRRQNPCRSRDELLPMYSLRKYAKDLPPNPMWEEVFQVYTNYHRTCMRAVGDIAQYFNERNTTTGCQFVVGDTPFGIGLGNKLQVVANSIFYGIITRRVILLPTSHLVTSYVCEPFVGSSWALDSKTFPTPPENNRNTWELSGDVFKHIDKYKRSCHPGEDPPATELPYASGDTTNMKQPYQRFYCATEQSFYSEITWVYLSGCLYTIPKTFAIPTFRPTLNALFPDKVVLTRVFRSVLLPADTVWSRVRRLHESYLQPADRRVGIQMRYLYGEKYFLEMHELVNQRLLDCVVTNGILPDVDKSSEANVFFTNSSSPSPPRIKVLITSLYLSLRDQMTKMYMRSPTLSGEIVDLVQVTHEDKQEFGLDIDVQAFTEVLLLSLTDNLILTPVSTFGGTAQSYGAHTPWFIEYRKTPDGLPSCVRSATTELCNQYTGLKYDCEYDKDVGRKPFAEVVPFIQDCPQIEFPYLSENEQGIELLTTFIS